MADGTPVSFTGPMGATDAYGLTGNKVASVGKLLMGPAAKKNRNKDSRVTGAKRFPRRYRKGM